MKRPRDRDLLTGQTASEEYKFFPASDTTVTAVYVPDYETIEEKILVNVDYIDYVSQAAANKAAFGTSFYVPGEYSFVKAGLIAVNKDNYNEETFYVGTSDSNVYDRSSTVNNGVFNWSKSNVFSGQTWVAKAYVQYRDENGDIQTVYSDLFEATKE